MAQELNRPTDLAEIRRDEHGYYTIGSFQGVPGIEGIPGLESTLGEDAGIGCFLGIKAENEAILKER
jgi:hypothetical protein